MTDHRVGTREEWLAARRELLEREKALTRRSDELAQERRELPWVPIEKEYVFQTDEGEQDLAGLFDGRSQLLVYHFMFGPDWEAGCPVCSNVADSFRGFIVHLNHHDVTMLCVSQAPLERLQRYKRRMGWDFPWVSSLGSDFNFDFAVSFTEEQMREGALYNFDRLPAMTEAPESGLIADLARGVGVEPIAYLQQGPGMSAFVLEDGVVYHTYSAYARGLDATWGIYQWLDRAPKGRNEEGDFWIRRHDEYAVAQRSG